MCAVVASVLFKTFLRIAVEGECGDGAVEMWGSKAPGAVGTAPAGEVISFAPDRTFACVWDSSSGAARATHQCIERGR